ncbi:hypothetical protein [Labrys neptuniae]|uniref:DUF3471 domain-containing protein n=1 Tax=Labrys neptuniae TaxID=376174 RepID=A0ABV3PVH7_9HYPH
MTHAQLCTLIQQTVKGDKSAEERLRASASLLRLWAKEAAIVVLSRENGDAGIYLGWYPGRGGGLETVPLPQTFTVIDAHFEGEVFTLQSQDGRSVSATWRGFHQIRSYLLPTHAVQRSPGDLDRIFAYLHPGKATGNGTSRVAGSLEASDGPYAPLFNYEGRFLYHDQEIFLAVHAVSEKHLQTMLPGLDHALVRLDNALPAARRLLAEGMEVEPSEMGTLSLSEIVHYDGGATDLVFNADEETQDQGVDFFTVHCDVTGVPKLVSMG